MMVVHKTFSERVVSAEVSQEKQDALREKVQLFVNDPTTVQRVISISESFLPEEGAFAITVWYHTPAEERRRPEEMSAELLDRMIHGDVPHAMDLVTDQYLVKPGPG